MAKKQTNKTNIKSPIGRPRKLSSPDEFERLAQIYFTECDQKEKPYTVTGLALAAGFTSREMLCEYAKREEFTDAIKRAKMKIEAKLEELLFDRSYSTAGIIFNLKNNYGWRDKQDVELTGNNGEAVRIEKIAVKMQ